MSGGNPGWFPDPLGRYELRYHNGVAWTADVATQGRRSIDPAGTAPTPAAPWAPMGPRPRNASAIAAMVCGIVAVTLAWVPFVAFAMVALAVVAIALGVRGRRQSQFLDGSGNGQALAGLWTGAAALALSVVGIVLTFSFTNAYRRYENPAAHDVQVLRCDRDVEVAITNLDDDPADFALLVKVERDGRSDSTHRLVLDDVAPGTTTSGRIAGVGDVDGCNVRVDGPLPWGFDPEGIDS